MKSWNFFSSLRPSTLALTVLLVGLFAASPLSAAENENTAAPESAQDDLAKRLLEFTGAKRVKVVCEGSIFGDKDGVWGFDTATGKEQLLYEMRGGFGISRDGETLAIDAMSVDNYNCGVWTVGWDGTPPRQLPTEGECDRLSCIWTDPDTRHKWIYVCDHGRHQLNPPMTEGPWDRWNNGTKLVRIRLDDPKIVEPIWKSDGAAGICAIGLSYDGKKAVSFIGFPKIGIYDFTSGEVRQVSQGCQFNMAPGNSYWFMHFKGNHKQATVFNREHQIVNAIEINSMPDMNGREVFNFRWSNHPRFFTVKAPEKGNGQIYLGRFDETYTKVEAWLQLTDSNNERKERLGMVWIDEATADEGVASFEKERGIVSAEPSH